MSYPIVTRAIALSFVTVLSLALGSTISSAQPYRDRGQSYNYNSSYSSGYTSSGRAQMEQSTGN
jgi:hypothetical protein